MVDHAHVFWFCSSIQMFWKYVATITTDVLGFNIDTTFTSLFFRLIPDEPSNDDKYILKSLLATEKKKLLQSIGYRKMDLL